MTDWRSLLTGHGDGSGPAKVALHLISASHPSRGVGQCVFCQDDPLQHLRYFLACAVHSASRYLVAPPRTTPISSRHCAPVDLSSWSVTGPPSRIRRTPIRSTSTTSRPSGTSTTRERRWQRLSATPSVKPAFQSAKSIPASTTERTRPR